MTSLAFYASPIEETQSPDGPSKGSSAQKLGPRRTYKRKPSSNSLPAAHVAKMIDQIHESTGTHRQDHGDDSPDMGQFNPPAHPISGKEKKIGEEEARPPAAPAPYAGGDAPVGPVRVEGFGDGSPGPGSSDSMHSYLPYYTATADGMGPSAASGAIHGDESARRDELLKKLDYMIHLLEEQHEERTGHVAEEVVLYSFLGVFVIFVVDSFARAGKYVR